MCTSLDTLVDLHRFLYVLCREDVGSVLQYLYIQCIIHLLTISETIHYLDVTDSKGTSSLLLYLTDYFVLDIYPKV